MLREAVAVAFACSLLFAAASLENSTHTIDVLSNGDASVELTDRLQALLAEGASVPAMNASQRRTYLLDLALTLHSYSHEVSDAEIKIESLIRAVESYQELVGGEPSDGLLHGLLGEAMREASGLVTEIQDDPSLNKSSGTLALLARVRTDSLLTEAISSLAQSVKLLSLASPRDAGVSARFLTSLGLGLADLGKWRDAVAVFNESCRLAADDPGCYVNLGNALHQLGRLSAAADAFFMATDEGVENARTERTGFRPLPALPIAPATQVRALFGLGSVLKDMTQFRAAASTFSKALSFFSGKHEQGEVAEVASIGQDAVTKLVWCLLETDAVNRAVSVLDFARKRFPDMLLWPYLGAIDCQVGDCEVMRAVVAQMLHPGACLLSVLLFAVLL